MNTRLSFTIPAIAFSALSFAACGTATPSAESSTSSSSMPGRGSTSATSATTAPTGDSIDAAPTESAAAVTLQVPVVFSGGYETEVVDNGRPVVLVASLLGVEPTVFRTAFSGVTPASGGDAPQSAQIGLNKSALLSVLGPYGVSNDELDAASNHYRYMAANGETWDHAGATAVATVVDGVVTTVAVTDAGRGYSSTPTASITLPDGSVVTAVVTVRYSADFATNGSVAAIDVAG